jgi:hypothetical protein
MTAPTPRHELIAIAKAYRDAMETGDPTGVALAPQAWQSEQGHLVDPDADSIRRHIAGNAGKVRFRETRWFVDGADVICFCLGDIEGATLHIASRTRIADGVITELESVFSITPLGS